MAETVGIIHHRGPSLARRSAADSIGMELAGLASLHKFDSVIERSGPIETTAECLADEGP